MFNLQKKLFILFYLIKHFQSVLKDPDNISITTDTTTSVHKNNKYNTKK